MIRSAAALALFLLAACASAPEPTVDTMRTETGAPVISSSAMPVATGSPASYRPGFATIESISLAQPLESASAGGTAPAARGPYRISLRMDDGRTQTMVVDSRAFLVGDRVQVMPDGRLIRA